MQLQMLALFSLAACALGDTTAPPVATHLPDYSKCTDTDADCCQPFSSLDDSDCDSGYKPLAGHCNPNSQCENQYGKQGCFGCFPVTERAHDPSKCAEAANLNFEGVHWQGDDAANDCCTLVQADITCEAGYVPNQLYQCPAEYGCDAVNDEGEKYCFECLPVENTFHESKCGDDSNGCCLKDEAGDALPMSCKDGYLPRQGRFACPVKTTGTVGCGGGENDVLDEDCYGCFPPAFEDGECKTDFWPGARQVCGDCKVVTKLWETSCDEYCGSIGLECISAVYGWCEASPSPDAVIGCSDDAYADTTCECADEQSLQSAVETVLEETGELPTEPEEPGTGLEELSSVPRVTFTVVGPVIALVVLLLQ